ncbi:Uncharacterised protein [Cedecea neteri]|uniref:Uncharacterized protein n=1 Tax=Cedecea neteri TaxID=158822 RepID=A0A2X3JF33_9ENTR|nr:Uncharacterised protein [Cedecea neteri]
MHQVGTVRPVFATTQAFTLTGRLNLDAGGGEDAADTPDAALPAGFRKIQRQPGIKLQLGLDDLQRLGGLLGGIKRNDDEFLQLADDAPEVEELLAQRGFGLAARAAMTSFSLSGLATTCGRRS